MTRGPWILGFVIFLFLVILRQHRSGVETIADPIASFFLAIEVLCGIVALALKDTKSTK